MASEGDDPKSDEGGVDEESVDDGKKRDSLGARFGTAALTPVAALVPALVGAALGLVFGLVFLSDLGSGDTEGIGITLSALVGAVIGFYLGCLLAGLFLSRNRGFPPSVQLLIALWVPLLSIAASAVGSFAERSGLTSLVLIVTVIVGVCIWAAIGAMGARQEKVRLVLGAVAVLAVVVGISIGGLSEDDYRAERFVEEQTPVAMVDEALLAEVLPGWTLEEYDHLVAHQFGWVKIRLLDDSGEDVDIDIRSQTLGCQSRQTCVDLEPLSDGSRVLSVEFECRDETFESPARIVVTRPTGSWSLEGQGSCEDDTASLEELELLLTTVSAATPEQWVDLSRDSVEADR